MDRKISMGELFMMLVVLQYGGYSWILPYVITQKNGSGSILNIILGGIAGLVMLWISCYLGKAAAGKPVLVYLQQIMPRLLAKVIGLGLWAYMVAFSIICLIFFTEMMNNELFPNTPRWIIAGMMILLVGRLVENGLEDIARFTVLSFGCLLLLFAMLLVGNWPLFHGSLALPLQLNDSNAFWQNTVLVGNTYLIVLCMIILYSHIRQHKHLFGIASASMLLSMVLMMVLIILAMGVFGQQASQYMIWLHLELAKVIQFGPHLERIEAIFIMLWMVVIFANSCILLYCANHSLVQLFHWPVTGKINWFLMAVVFLCCSQLQEINEVIIILRYFNVVSPWITIGGMLLALCFSFWAQHKAKEQ